MVCNRTFSASVPNPRSSGAPTAGHQGRAADGKTTASRNAYKGGHWLMLRNLSKLVNAEIREARDLVDSVR